MAARGSLQAPGSASQERPKPTLSKHAPDSSVVVVEAVDVSRNDVDFSVDVGDVGAAVAVLAVTVVLSVVGLSAVVA